MSGWISVKECTPPFCNEIIIITDGFEVIPGFYSSNHEWCEIGGIETELDIIFWMPLPEPPT